MRGRESTGGGRWIWAGVLEQSSNQPRGQLRVPRVVVLEIDFSAIPISGPGVAVVTIGCEWISRIGQLGQQ